MPCVISLFSRIFTVDQVKESTTHEPDGPAVHWLNAINPDLFTEEVVRYVKYTHHTIHHSSYSRCTYACSHTNSHTRTLWYAKPSNTPPPTV